MGIFFYKYSSKHLQLGTTDWFPVIWCFDGKIWSATHADVSDDFNHYWMGSDCDGYFAHRPASGSFCYWSIKQFCYHRFSGNF